MEAVCVKLDERTLKNLDSALKENNYSTRTDFIREAIRDKLRRLEIAKTEEHFKKYFGTAKKHVSDKELHEIREKVAREYAKKLGVNLD